MKQSGEKKVVGPTFSLSLSHLSHLPHSIRSFSLTGFPCRSESRSHKELDDLTVIVFHGRLNIKIYPSLFNYLIESALKIPLDLPIWPTVIMGDSSNLCSHPF